MDIREAALLGARMRFRAVMMSFALILGVHPLVVAQDAAELSRDAVGTPVFASIIAASAIGPLCDADALRHLPDHPRAQWHPLRAVTVACCGNRLGAHWVCAGPHWRPRPRSRQCAKMASSLAWRVPSQPPAVFSIRK